jgi:hypothetical protein
MRMSCSAFSNLVTASGSACSQAANASPTAASFFVARECCFAGFGSPSLRFSLLSKHAAMLVLCWSLLVSAGFPVLCWFCVGLCWSLPNSLFCAGLSWSLSDPVGFAVLCWFWLVSAGRCRFHCFVLVLCWSLLVCAGFALVPQKTLQLFSRHFVGIAKRYIHIAMSWMFVHYPSVDELARPSTTPSVGELNQQNACTAEDANSTLSGRCEPSGGRSRAISRRRLGFAHTKIAPVAQRLPSGRVMVPAWGAVAQGTARGLGARYVGAALSLLDSPAPWHSRLLPLLRLGSSWTSSAARSLRFFPEASSR